MKKVRPASNTVGSLIRRWEHTVHQRRVCKGLLYAGGNILYIKGEFVRVSYTQVGTYCTSKESLQGSLIRRWEHTVHQRRVCKGLLYAGGNILYIKGEFARVSYTQVGTYCTSKESLQTDMTKIFGKCDTIFCVRN